MEQEPFETMLAGLTAKERYEATWSGDDLLGETLARLAAALDSRGASLCESGRAGETGGVVPAP